MDAMDERQIAEGSDINLKDFVQTCLIYHKKLIRKKILN